MATATCLPLSRDAFARFGAVVEATGQPGRPANDGRALRYDQPLEWSHRAPARDPALAIYAIDPSELPLRIDYMERHPASCQLFLPMDAARYLVAAAGDTPEGAPCAQSLRAFIATPRQGVCYRPGVWHYPLVALDRAASFAMFMWQAADAADDCEARDLNDRVEVCE